MVAQSFLCLSSSTTMYILGGRPCSSALLSHHRVTQLLLYLSTIFLLRPPFVSTPHYRPVIFLFLLYSPPSTFSSLQTDRNLPVGGSCPERISARRALEEAALGGFVYGAGAVGSRRGRQTGLDTNNHHHRLHLHRHDTSPYSALFVVQLHPVICITTRSIILPPARRGYTRSALPLSMHS